MEGIDVAERICSVESCGKPQFRREWCAMHYTRLLRHGALDASPKVDYTGITCAVTNCGKQPKGRGLCNLHYQRWRSTGTTDAQVRVVAKVDPFVRFIASTEIHVDGCWLRQGSINTNGYAAFQINGSQVRAHRWLYERMVGPIPADLQLDHLCRVRNCVRPDHLEAVTASENTRRSTSPAARNAVKTHCKRGHEFTPENTDIKPGGRACRECARLLSRRHYWRKKNASA